MSNSSDARRSFLSRLGSLFSAGAAPLKRCIRDKASFRGEVMVTAIHTDGTREVLVDDHNLVVALGRRAMSRLIAGAVASPTLLRGTLPAIRLIRDTGNVPAGGAPTSAWVRFYQIDGTNTFRFMAQVTDGTVTATEIDMTITGGTKTISQLVADIDGAARWYASVVGTAGSVDATNLLKSHDAAKLMALGDQASYSGGFSTSPYYRELRAISTNEETSLTVANLFVSRMRFGSEGYQPATPSLGQDVIATDEHLSAALRAADYGESLPANDFLPTTASYATTPSQVTFVSTLDQDSGVGLSISEVGLFNGGNAMIAKKTFGQIVKTNLFSIEVRWTLIF